MKTEESSESESEPEETPQQTFGHFGQPAAEAHHSLFDLDLNPDLE